MPSVPPNKRQHPNKKNSTQKVKPKQYVPPNKRQIQNIKNSTQKVKPKQYVPPHKRQRQNIKNSTQKVKPSGREYRYKSIVIPYIKTTDNVRSYVLVKDKTSGDLTFVVGGCKENEIPKKRVRDSTFYSDYDSYKTCALRELNEESRGVFKNVSEKALKQGFKFRSKERSTAERNKDAIKGADVTMRYTVYYLPLDMTKTAFSVLRKRFANMRPKKAENNETSDIVLETKHELDKLDESEDGEKLWSFMKEWVLPKLR